MGQRGGQGHRGHEESYSAATHVSVDIKKVLRSQGGGGTWELSLQSWESLTSGLILDSIGSFMPPHEFSPHRRDLLKGLAAFGASALLAQTPAPAARVIDCHHHFVSPAFLKALSAKEGHKVEGFTNFFPLGLWKNYSPAKDIEGMDRDGVATSLISCTGGAVLQLHHPVSRPDPDDSEPAQNSGRGRWPAAAIAPTLP